MVTDYNAGTEGVDRAVRWDAGGTAATALGTLGTNRVGDGNAIARAINSSGVIVGQADRYDGESFRGSRPVRWDAGSTAPTELDVLDPELPNADIKPAAMAINEHGDAVGVVSRVIDGVYHGSRAALWAAGGTKATELVPLSTAQSGWASSVANSINTAGDVVGSSILYDGANDVGGRAVIWSANEHTPLDLNTLSDAGPSWELVSATAINDNGTIVGWGLYYPDGGPALGFGHEAAFRLDPIPEPSFWGALGIFVVYRAGKLRSYRTPEP